MAGIARLSERLRLACAQCQDAVDDVRTRAENARLGAYARFGSMYEVDDQGNRHLLGSETFSLSRVEQNEWEEKAREERERASSMINSARLQLFEEIAVVRMMVPSLRPQLDRVATESDYMALSIGNRPDVAHHSEALNAAVTVMWNVATGTMDASSVATVLDSGDRAAGPPGREEE